MNSTARRTGSPSQYALLKRLVIERNADQDPRVLAYRETWRVQGFLTAAQTRAFIDYMLDMPRALANIEAAHVFEPYVAPAPIEAGVYVAYGDQYYRVYLGQKSGRMLAKRINFERDGEHVSVHYDRPVAAGRVINRASTPERLSVEEVGALGVTCSQCLICGRRLDDPESVDRGIGPVCASRY